MANNEIHHINLGTELGYLQRTRPFHMQSDDLFKHVYINGKTGVGKSTILKILYASIVSQGFGCTLVDFNGDLADDVLHHTPPHRIDDVIFMDLADLDYAIPTNPFHGVPFVNHATFAEQFARSLEHIYQNSWGNRMGHLLKNTTRALCDAPPELRPTIYSIAHVLTNKHYRKQVFGAAKHPELIAYYKNELSQKTPREIREYSEPILNKVGDLTGNPYILNSMASYTPKFKFNIVIKNKSILILRLPKGLVGTCAKLYGSLAVSSIVNEAYAQQALSHADRVPHFMLIDETHNIEHSCLVEPLAETRKYKLGLVIASQYTKQLDTDLRDALFGNAGTIIAYQSSQHDAEIFSSEMGDFHPRRFTDLKLGQTIIRSLEDGSTYGPFRADIHPDDIPSYDNANEIRTLTRARYALPTSVIQERFARWVNKEMLDPAVAKHQRRETSGKQRKRTIASFDRHLSQADDRPLSRVEHEHRIKHIKDILDNRGRIDPDWPKDLKLHKKNRRRKRRPAQQSN